MHSSIVALGLAAFASSVSAVTYDVNVGPNGQFVYDPPYVNAVYGDVVRFHFNPKNHTVTQSAFDPPCVPLAGEPFRTGFVPVAPGTDPLPTFDFHVPDNHGAPLWFYCGQTGHCGQGMVFAINPPAPPPQNSFEAFRDLAIARNGTSATAPPTGSATSTAPDNYTTPPPPQWTMATATVTWGGNTYQTVYTSYAGTPEPTPAVTPQDHRIVVGADGQLSYNPANITAAINDTVTFEFRPKNHTVTQSTFSNPCEGKPDGFKSGFRPVAADSADVSTFTIKINDTAPIWGYCGQTGHCQAGMVFSINAVESGPNNFAAFQQLARRPTNSSSSTDGGANTGNGGNTTTGDNGGNGGNGNGAGVITPTVGISAFTFVLAGLTAMLL
jgi:plastocyanin